MIKFFKKLLGIKTPCACPSTPKETVAEILTPPVVETVKVETYVAPAKPANKKVKAISAPVQAKTKPAVQKPAVTEGKAKGGNNVVKLQPKQSNKPRAPGKPKAKRK
mgnify:CR=1 FL=1